MSITSRINEMSSHIEQAYDELQGLGADLTNVNKNIENISMVLDDIYDSMPQVSGEGTSLTLDDTRVGKIKSTLKGNTSQTTYSGKNLFNIEGSYETGTGITYTKNSDGSYTLNGTANGNNFLRGLCYLNEQHTISYTSNVSNSNVIIRTRTGTPTAQTGIQDQLAVSSTSGNLTSSKQFDFVEISIVNGTTLNNFKIYIQLEKGSSVTSFEPYVGGITSPNPSYPQPVNVVSGDNEINVVGKNLNKTSITVNLTSGNEKWTGVSLSEVNWVSGTTYYIKAFLDKQSNEVVQISNYGYMRIDESSVKTITYNGTPPYVRVGANTLNSNITNEEVKIMVSTETFTDFEAYSGDTYSIDLPVENLFNLDTIAENTYLSYDGTTGSSSVTNMSDYIQILPSKPCTISYACTTLMNTNQRGYCWYTENKTFISGSTYSPFVNDIPVTLTAPSNAKYIRFAYDKNCTNIQLQQSSKVTPYGTTPIELCKIGTYQDKIAKSTGKNLFDYNDLANKVQTFTTSGTANNFTVVGYGTCQYPISISTNAIISGSWSTTNLNGDVKAIYTDDTNENIFSSYTSSSASGTINFTPTKTIKAIQFRTFNGNNNITFNNFMINEGTTALPYEPYGTSWYLHKEIGKVVLDGTQAGARRETNTNNCYRFTITVNNVLRVANSDTKGAILCDKFVTNTLSNTYMLIQGINAGITSTDYYRDICIYCDETKTWTWDEFKTWLASNNVTLYYALATPINELVEYQPLIDQLNLLEQVTSKENQTNISQVNNDLPFIISASALKEWQENTSLNSTLSMVNPLSLGNTLNTQDNNTQPIEVDNIEPLEEEENEES